MPVSSEVTLFDTDCIVCGTSGRAPLKYSSTTSWPLRTTSSDVIDPHVRPRMRPTRLARRAVSRPWLSGVADAHSAVASTGVNPGRASAPDGPAGDPLQPYAASASVSVDDTSALMTRM